MRPNGRLGRFHACGDIDGAHAMRPYGWLDRFHVCGEIEGRMPCAPTGGWVAFTRVGIFPSGRTVCSKSSPTRLQTG
jgi:hypothetical protein